MLVGDTYSQTEYNTAHLYQKPSRDHSRASSSDRNQTRGEDSTALLERKDTKDSEWKRSRRGSAQRVLGRLLAGIMGEKGTSESSAPRSSVRPSVCQDNKRLVFNVCGKRYETYERTLSRFPDCLLSLPQRELFYDPAKEEYFFDRNRKAFGAILTYCQTKVLVKPTNLDDRIFAAELRYFGFDKESEIHSPPQPATGDSDRPLPSNHVMQMIWELFEYPDTSFFARIIALFSVTVILLSIVMFCLETLPEFKEPVYAVRKNENGTVLFKTIKGERTKLKYVPVFFALECACIAWFTLEYTLRLFSAPKKLRFLYQPLNIIDLVAILPFYITIVLNTTGSNVSSLSILRVLRLVRVFRIFKLSRYSKGLKILGYTFKASLQELGLLAFFLLIGIVLFASAAYYCEEGVANTKFESIPHSFWWAIVTMTTVGYGDMTPETLGGKLVGSFCVLLGVLAIAFPVPVIVNNFTYYYTLELRQPDGLDEEYTESPLGRRRPSSQGSVSPEVAVDKLNGNTPNEKSLMRDDEVFLEHKVNRGNKTFARENSMGNDSLLEDVKVEQGMENWTQVESKV